MKQILSIAMALSLAAGCASMDDTQRTRAEGLGIGAIAGAVLGGVIGEATKNDPGTGALIGGMVGGLAGGLYGDRVARKKSEFANREDFLDASVAQASKVRTESEAYNVAMQKEVDALDAQAAQLLASIQSGESRKGELDALRARGKAKLVDAENTIKNLNVEIALQRQTLTEEQKANPNGERLVKLQEQVQALEQQRDQLQQRTQRLASINNRMSV